MISRILRCGAVPLAALFFHMTPSPLLALDDPAPIQAASSKQTDFEPTFFAQIPLRPSTTHTNDGIPTPVSSTLQLINPGSKPVKLHLAAKGQGGVTQARIHWTLRPFERRALSLLRALPLSMDHDAHQRVRFFEIQAEDQITIAPADPPGAGSVSVLKRSRAAN